MRHCSASTTYQNAGADTHCTKLNSCKALRMLSCRVDIQEEAPEVMKALGPAVLSDQS